MKNKLHKYMMDPVNVKSLHNQQYVDVSWRDSVSNMPHKLIACLLATPPLSFHSAAVMGNTHPEPVSIK